MSGVVSVLLKICVGCDKSFEVNDTRPCMHCDVAMCAVCASALCRFYRNACCTGCYNSIGFGTDKDKSNCGRCGF